MSKKRSYLKKRLNLKHFLPNYVLKLLMFWLLKSYLRSPDKHVYSFLHGFRV